MARGVACSQPGSTDSEDLSQTVAEHVLQLGWESAVIAGAQPLTPRHLTCCQSLLMAKPAF